MVGTHYDGPMPKSSEFRSSIYLILVGRLGCSIDGSLAGLGGLEKLRSLQ